MRRGVVLLFLGFVAFGLIVAIAIRPAEPIPLGTTVAGTVAQLGEGREPLVMKDAVDGHRILRVQRDRYAGPVFALAPASRPADVAILRDDAGGIRAFVAIDPRTACELRWNGSFVDVCHGSTYDRNGRYRFGPSPYHLNELATSVEGQRILVHLDRVIPGPCHVCSR